jgi:rubredoxin
MRDVLIPSPGLQHCVAPSNKKSRKIDIKKMKPYRCEACGYIYDPARGEPKIGIAPGTAFKDLPKDYTCPVCGKAKRGKAAFTAMEAPTGGYRCIACGYVYDPERGEPKNGSKPGTAFEDLPDNSMCPVCSVNARIGKECLHTDRITLVIFPDNKKRKFA